MSRVEREGGFTLIEAMVAVTVLGLVLVSALAAAAADLRASRRSSVGMELAQLGEEVVSQIDTYSAGEFQRLLAGRAERFPSPMDHYRWEARVITGIDDPSIFEIHVRVEGMEASFTIHTQRFRRMPRAFTSTGELR
jgi:prepilin-type N-terminal cleavage/methylation domain-containing protein